MANLTFYTVCMNRLHHLRVTLVQNLWDNRDRNDVSFVVLDYGSTDGLQEWVEDELQPHLQSGLLQFYRCATPTHFKRSHSRNVALRLCKGDIVCNIDADNFTGPNFASFVLGAMHAETNSFVCADTTGSLYNIRDAIGRIAAWRQDMLDIGGYDENIVNYGYEDNDLLARLQRLGRRPVVIPDASHLQSIKHDDLDRVGNEKLLTLCEQAFRFDANEFSCSYLFLLRDGTFRLRHFVDAPNVFAAEPHNLWSSPIPTLRWFRLFGGNQVEVGAWSREGNVFLLHGSGESFALTQSDGSGHLWGHDPKTQQSMQFMPIHDREYLARVAVVDACVENLTIVNAQQSPSRTRANTLGFGIAECIGPIPSHKVESLR